jgi:hypothetical protein
MLMAPSLPIEIEASVCVRLQLYGEPGNDWAVPQQSSAALTGVILWRQARVSQLQMIAISLEIMFRVIMLVQCDKRQRKTFFLRYFLLRHVGAHRLRRFRVDKHLCVKRTWR